MKIFRYRFQTFSNSKGKEKVKTRDESEFLNSNSVKRIEHKEYRKKSLLSSNFVSNFRILSSSWSSRVVNISLEKKTKAMCTYFKKVKHTKKYNYNLSSFSPYKFAILV